MRFAEGLVGGDGDAVLLLPFGQGLEEAFVGDITVTGEYESLAQYFDPVAEMLTKAADGSYPVCGVTEGRLVWT